MLFRHVAFFTGLLIAVGLGTAARAEDLPMPRLASTTGLAPPTSIQPLPGQVAASSPKPAYASLAAAVAAQDGTIADEHLRCLAGAVYFESQGQPLTGQLAVARVILNRIRSGRFASSVCGVVLQRGQFGFVRGGVIPALDTSRAAYRTAVAIAKVALSEAWTATGAAEALYFNGVHARRVGGRLVAVIGGHAFYR